MGEECAAGGTSPPQRMNSVASQSPLLTNTIYLVGFMGCGKTTVGKLLAQRIAWKFIDLDSWIEQEEGMSIADIFARAGEPAFRRREQELLRRIVQESPGAPGRVVALGGGTFAQPANRELIQGSRAVSIWLDCPMEELLMRCALLANRPLFRDEASFRKLYEERLPFYRQATFTVRSGRGDASEVVQQILSLAIFREIPCLSGSDHQHPPSAPSAA